MFAAAGARPLVLFLLLGLLVIPIPFLLSPEPDLEHHLKSTLDRLLSHWLGAAVLVGGAVAAWREDPVSRPATARPEPA
ncbi:MAG: hypothetical protein ABIP94_06840 [Planctomycetota bacterium]